MHVWCEAYKLNGRMGSRIPASEFDESRVWRRDSPPPSFPITQLALMDRGLPLPDIYSRQEVAKHEVSVHIDQRRITPGA